MSKVDLKYRLTDETITVVGKVLHRIEALRDLPGIDVKQGDKGGFVESDRNLCHMGNAWVGGNGRVFENARVLGRARVLGDAQVSGDARVGGNALVGGDEVVTGPLRARPARDVGLVGGGIAAPK
jgi:hypothetical protein